MSAVIDIESRRAERLSSVDQPYLDRIAASENRDYIVEIDEGATIDQVAAYLGIPKDKIFNITKRFGPELSDTGYKAGSGITKSTFSRRAILHLCMLLPAKHDGKPREIRQKLGVWTDKKPQIEDMSHLGSCKSAVERATDVIEQVRDIAPDDLWNELSKLDRWQIQALAVALATMVNPDQTTGQLTAYLLDISRLYRDDPHASHGLLKMTPPRPPKRDRSGKNV